jgi:hypothetical protein
MPDDDNIIVFVRDAKRGTCRQTTKERARADPDVHLRNKRDWVADENGVARDTIVGEEYVENEE